MKVVSPHENAPPEGLGLRLPDGERILEGEKVDVRRLVGEGSREMGRYVPG